MKKVAVVSGATGGIGGTVTKRLWREGYSVIALGRTQERLDELTQWLFSQQVGVHATQAFAVVKMDVSVAPEYWRLHNAILDMEKHVDLLVLCHGSAPQPSPALYETTGHELFQCYQVDIAGTLGLFQAVGRYMIEQRAGTVCVVSSIHAHATYPQRLAYATAKASLGGMVRSLALEWGRYNITVNAICPWQVEGHRTDQYVAYERKQTGADTLVQYRNRSPLRSILDAEEIAETVLWMTRMPHLTGQEIVIDAGVSISAWHKPYSDGAMDI